jgi:hypothetical protein
MASTEFPKILMKNVKGQAIFTSLSSDENAYCCGPKSQLKLVKREGNAVSTPVRNGCVCAG